MLGIAILFVVFFCRCLVFPEQVPDTATIQNDPLEDKLASLLRDHEATTASLLRQQDNKWASLLRDQESKTASLLREQDDRWSSLLEAKTTSFLRDQKVKTASLLGDQGTLLADLTSLLQKQGQKISDQERSQRQLKHKVLDQEYLLRHQDQKLSHQESLLQEQGARLSYQEALLLKHGRVILQLKNRHVRPQTFLDVNLRHATNTSQPKTALPGKTSDSAFRDVITRSDDGGPLEVVVSHISQRVTKMGADIQVFKTQIVNDIQTLKTQTVGDIQTLQNSNTQQDLAILEAQSSTFVHWGSSTCSSLSHTIYSGVVGGSRWTDTGAATNYLCLSISPVFSDHAVPTYIAYLYGSEYETYDSHKDKDPACAVCRSTLSTTVMIPGTNVCTPGWHLQYSGYLMAGNAGQPAGSEYICVDSRLENTVHGDADENGALLYYTVTHCGSLPCTPYVHSKVVTCAVCSK